MSIDREIFGSTGPFHLQNIDWSNAIHRRSVAASLVQGAYNLEHDRKRIVNGSTHSQAPPWWEFFGFQLHQVLVDADDGSYFGAIYEYKYYFHYSHCNPPRYVIAFRGTLTAPENRKQDLILDFQFICHNLHKCSRFDCALQAVQNIVSTTFPGNVWLAGHSLGSAIALTVGRKMVSMNKSYLETYLFNPPFDSPPIEHIKHEKIKDGIRIASSFLVAGIASMVHHQGQGKTEETNDDSFSTLCEWVPYLFLNRSDPICCEYIGYFTHREKMVQIGAGKIGQTATQNSVVSVVSNAIGKDYEAIHLIPSAYLTINLSNVSDIKQAHGIQQWWRPDIHCDFKLYRYK